MAEKDNKNKRKFAAVLLGIVGVAGLSVASASTLTVDTQTEVALGTDVFAPCQPSANVVTVDYGYDTDFTIDEVTVSGIVAACEGEDVKVQVANAAGNAVLMTPAAKALADGDSAVSFDVSSDGISVQDDLGEVTVVIG